MLEKKWGPRGPPGLALSELGRTIHRLCSRTGTAAPALSFFFFFSETLSGVRIAPSEHVTMQASAILRMVWTTEKGFLEVHTDADSSQEPLSGVSTALLLEEGEPPFQPAQHPATWSSHLVTQQKTLSLFT